MYKLCMYCPIVYLMTCSPHACHSHAMSYLYPSVPPFRPLPGCLGVLQQQYAWQQLHADQHVGNTTDIQHQFSSLWPVQQQQHHFSSQLPHQHQLPQQEQQQSGQQPQPHQRSMAVLKLYTGNWILPVRFLVGSTSQHAQFPCVPASEEAQQHSAAAQADEHPAQASPPYQQELFEHLV